MTFATKLEALAEKATPRPWVIDNDHRPGMAWNRHIFQDGTENAICFMSHGKSPEADLAKARLIVMLANTADALLRLVRAVTPYQTPEHRNCEVCAALEELNRSKP